MLASSKEQEICTFSIMVTKRSIIHLKYTSGGPRTQFSSQGFSSPAHVPKNTFSSKYFQMSQDIKHSKFPHGTFGGVGVKEPIPHVSVCTRGNHRTELSYWLFSPCSNKQKWTG